MNWQANIWSPNFREVPGSARHRPEAWTGDLGRAPIIFLASNPSFGVKVNFPNWGDNWNDKDIAGFGVDRFDIEKHKTFGAADSTTFKHADRVLVIDGKMSKRVSHWQWVRRFADGGKIERAMVVLDKPIKTLGLHQVKVRLHAEVLVSVTLNIARSQDEADRQARGENIIDAQFEEERVIAEQAAADLLEGGAGQAAQDFSSSDA